MVVIGQQQPSNKVYTILPFYLRKQSIHVLPIYIIVRLGVKSPQVPKKKGEPRKRNTLNSNHGGFTVERTSNLLESPQNSQSCRL